MNAGPFSSPHQIIYSDTVTHTCTARVKSYINVFICRYALFRDFWRTSFETHTCENIMQSFKGPFHIKSFISKSCRGPQKGLKSKNGISKHYFPNGPLHDFEIKNFI